LSLDRRALGGARCLGFTPRLGCVAARVRRSALEVGEARLVKESGQVALVVGGVLVGRSGRRLAFELGRACGCCQGGGGRRTNDGGDGGDCSWRGRIEQSRVQLVRGRVVRRDRWDYRIVAGRSHCVVCRDEPHSLPRAREREGREGETAKHWLFKRRKSLGMRRDAFGDAGVDVRVDSLGD
jgi:hypothetical protein